MIVIDASAVLEVLLRRREMPGLELRLSDRQESLHAPPLIEVEVAQVLRRYALSGQIPEPRCHQALSDFTDLPLVLHDHTPFLSRVWELRHNLTAYDAVYVALAEALRAPLLTADRRLAASSGHDARIEVV